MSIKFRYDSATYTLWSSASRVTTPSLCHRKDGTTYYTPLLTSRSQTIGDYVYYASSPYMKNPVCVKKDGVTYYATFFRNLIYDIPEGTYDPLVFENLIKNYIPLLGGRWARVGTGLFKVNNQVEQIVNEEGKCFIYYGSTSSGSGLSSGEYRFVSFTKSPSNLIFPEVQDLTNFRGMYIVKGTEPFQEYSNFPITIFGGSDIKFI